MRRMMGTSTMEPDSDLAAEATKPGTDTHGSLTPSVGPAEAEDTAALPSVVADELFSILSHELRAPLTTIKGSSRTLLRHGAVLEPAAARQLLTDIDHEADRLHRLIDNLLQLARAGTGTASLRTEPTALDVLMRRVVADATPRAGQRRLRVRVPADLPQPTIDAVKIEQVLRNLVDNAVKFSPVEGSIDVSAGVQGTEIVIAVKDEGPGVAPEYQHRVFERFFRVEREHSSVAGAGLGLAICKRFVELHGGRIELDSPPGHGATFRFTLPLRGEAASATPPNEAPAS
jgi:two-component system phosphate regulon sensor histidine kinase PhoR